MSWARIDDDFPNHPKVWRAGLDGVALFVEGLCHASKFLTDGALKREDVERMRLVRRPLDVATKLVSLGLWERRGDGFHIHDYLHYNPPAETVRKKRDAARQRMKEKRDANVRANKSGTFARDSLGDGQSERTSQKEGETGEPRTNGYAHRVQSVPNEEEGERAAAFLERFKQLFAKFGKGAKYPVREARDWPTAVDLIRLYDDARLDRMVEVMLRSPAFEGKIRNLGMLIANAGELDRHLREHGE